MTEGRLCVSGRERAFTHWPLSRSRQDRKTGTSASHLINSETPVVWLDDANQTVGPDKVFDRHGPVHVRLAFRAVSPLFELDAALRDPDDDAQLTVVPLVMGYPQFPYHRETCACVNPVLTNDRKVCDLGSKA